MLNARHGEVGDNGVIDHPPKVNLDEMPYSYFQPAVALHITDSTDTSATLNIGDAKVVVQSGGLGAYPSTGSVKKKLTRLAAIQLMSLKHADASGNIILGLDADFDKLSSYVADMNQELKTFLESPMPKERWKQRKPMYQKKVKKEVKLHPLLGGFTPKKGR